MEAGKGTIGSTTAISWLKNERPKVAIYPHQTDYYDFCVIVKKNIQSHQQTINRLLQSGNATTEESQQCESSKKECKRRLQEHKDVARLSLQYYQDTIQKCTQQWKEITKLESAERSPENYERLEELKNVFTLLLSADYQMSKLLPFWGHSAQPRSTYYLQKVSYDLYGIDDNRQESEHLYTFNETIGAKNTDHSFSYILYYLKSTGKVASWVTRVHNQYMMASIFEIVQQSIFKYFRVSFMVAGYTKFAPHRLFALTAKAFYASDIFNEKELILEMENHALSPLMVAVSCVAGGTQSPKSTQTCQGSMISWH